MFEKIKSHINKKYAAISAYVIVTVIIIFALSYFLLEIGSIFKTAAGILRSIGRMLLPVFIGIIIAYITNPMVAYTEKMLRRIKFFKLKNEKKYRSIAVLSCILFIVLVIFLLLGTFIFSITKQLSNLQIDKTINIVSSYINGFSDSLKNIEVKLSEMNIESKAIDQYAANFSSTLINWLTNFANNLASNTLNFSGYIYNFVFGLIIAIYLLIDKDAFISYGHKFSKAMFSERTQRKIKDYYKSFDYIFSGYIRGTLLDVLFMSVMVSLALSIIGIKFGMLIGIFAGLCHFIPLFGPIAAFAGTIIFGVLNAQYSQVVIAIIVLIIIQQVDANIIAPKLLGKSVDLKPVFILIALLIGADVGGILGMVLAVPVAALIKLILTRVMEIQLKKKELAVFKEENEQAEE